MFCTFYVGFPDGKPTVLPGLEKAFEREKGDLEVDLLGHGPQFQFNYRF